MRNGKKRARSEPNHPSNKYSHSPPDFAFLASLYPSFKPFVFFSGARPRIDWTDYNATRELTRILLLHDHSLNWWYTSMLGKKANLKLLIFQLWEVEVTIVKTTEFVQGQTSRWGLAWSFMPTTRKIISPPVAKKSVSSFMLEGIKRQYSAADVLQSVEEFFKSCGASCKLNSSTCYVDIVVSSDQCNIISKNGIRDVEIVRSHGYEKQSMHG